MPDGNWSVRRFGSIEEVLAAQKVAPQTGLDLEAAQAWVLPMPDAQQPLFGAESSDEVAAAEAAGLDLRFYTSGKPLLYLTESFLTEVVLPPVVFVAKTAYEVACGAASAYLAKLLERLSEKGQRGTGTVYVWKSDGTVVGYHGPITPASISELGALLGAASSSTTPASNAPQ
jgi:hypothetical protein